jgi:ankyrin repeat protein
MDLIEAIRTKNLTHVQELLGKGVCPNEADDHHKITPLHYAVSMNSPEAVLLLMTAGANLMAENLDGDTPLDLARTLQHTRCLDLLERMLSSAVFSMRLHLGLEEKISFDDHYQEI